MSMVLSQNSRLVSTSEHQLHIRDKARVKFEKLEEAPDAENCSRLVAITYGVYIKAPRFDHHRERCLVHWMCVCGLKKLFGDFARFPWCKVVMDEAEVVRALG